MKKIIIYCPVCLKQGRKKKLLEVDENAKGILYPYCKGHRGEVRIELPYKDIDTVK